MNNFQFYTLKIYANGIMCLLVQTPAFKWGFAILMMIDVVFATIHAFKKYETK